MESWTNPLLDRLLAARSPSGGWGYRAGTPAAAEPTALAALALAELEPDVDDSRTPELTSAAASALAELADEQRADGSVPAVAAVPAPGWPTALAVLAWARAGGGAGGQYQVNVRRATEWLLQTRGKRIRTQPGIFDHDTQRVGWPWVADTHSWVEPTAYAIMALRSAGLGGHERVAEARRLLLDRALPDGGWNYGNRRVLGTVLRPFVATTGIALTALAGVTCVTVIEKSIAYLQCELQQVRSPISLGWGLIGLRAWDAAPPAAAAWLKTSAARCASEDYSNAELALLLIASFHGASLFRQIEGATA